MLRSIAVCCAVFAAPLYGCQEASKPPVAPSGSEVPVAPSSAPAAPSTAGVVELFGLRTGTLEPVRHAEPLRGAVASRAEHGEQELLRIRIGWSGRRVHLDAGQRWTVTLAESGAQLPRALAFLLDARTDPRSSMLPRVYSELWVLRPKSEAGKPLRVDAYREHHGTVPGQHFRLEIPETSSAPLRARLVRDWAEAFAVYLRSLGTDISWRGDQLPRVAGPALGGPAAGTDYLQSHRMGVSAWHAFAADRILSVYAAHRPQPGGTHRGRLEDRLSSELVRLMETTTGASSIQAALQHDRPLYLEAVKRPRRIPLARVQAVRVREHPFAEMLRRLGRPVPAEPLADATPAEFYYLRFATLEALFAVIDQVQIWGTPTASIFSRRTEDHDLAVRYMTALGVDRSEVARVLGPKVIDQVALVGSDPYLREGSDLTLLFRVKHRSLFDQGLAGALRRYEARHGALTRSTAQHAGTTVTWSRSVDGAVSQQRADRAELTAISNSPAAMRRVVEAMRGQRPRLGDEADFRFMLARDAAVRDDVLGYASDRFVAAVVAPQQKILEARRQIALAELQTPGYAALLYGWVHGRRPISRQQVLSSGLLRRGELKHHDGSTIEWEPGQPARSAWGTSGALTPLIDLPVPQRVSRAEQQAYEQFARSYENRWSDYVDPFMLRLSLEPQARPPERLVADLRVLPLLENFDLRELTRMVGQARLRVPALHQGLRLVAGIGKDAGVRREVSRFGRGLPGGRDVRLDWPGDWVMIGLEEHPVVTRVAATLDDDLPQLPPTRQERKNRRDEGVVGVVAQLPVYAVIGIRSRVGAALALTAARSQLVEAVPDIEWGKYAEHNSTPLVRVRYREDCERRSDCSIDVFYALTSRELVVALREETLRHVLDELAARPPVVEAQGPDGQFVAELAPQPKGGLWTVAAWYLETEALASQHGSRMLAEVLLRGAPELAQSPEPLRQLALATFGAVPVTPDGALYQLSREGVLDPSRGTPFAPVWPPVPVAGSPVEALLHSVKGLRWETAFDDEGQTPDGRQMRSLHVRVTLGLSGGV